MESPVVVDEEEDDCVVVNDDADDQITVISEQIHLESSFVFDTEICDGEDSSSAYLQDEGEISSISLLSVDASFENGGSLKRLNSRRSVTCFNCLGEHIVSRCTEPIDQRRINANRESFSNRRNFINGPRFHEEQEKKFEAGVISRELRDALGLGRRELPPWIFRMRRKGLINGYPPGYRSKAMEKSTLKFILGGKSEGQNDDDKHEDEYVFDPTKVIRYAGFNAEPDRGAIDPEHGLYRAPPWHVYLSAFEQHVVEENRRALEAKRIRGELPPARNGHEPQPPLNLNLVSSSSASAGGGNFQRRIDQRQQRHRGGREDRPFVLRGRTNEEEEEEDRDFRVPPSLPRSGGGQKRPYNELDGVVISRVDLSHGNQPPINSINQQAPMFRHGPFPSAIFRLPPPPLAQQQGFASATAPQGLLPPPPPPPPQATVTQTQKSPAVGTPPPVKRQRRVMLADLEEGELLDGSSFFLDDGEELELCDETIGIDDDDDGAKVEEGGEKDNDQSVLVVGGGEEEGEENGVEEAAAVDVSGTLSLGTPIPLQRHISNDRLDHEFTKPALENWTKDIQPFQHCEEPPPANIGFFKKMRSIIKKSLGVGSGGSFSAKKASSSNGSGPGLSSSPASTTSSSRYHQNQPSIKN